LFFPTNAKMVVLKPAVESGKVWYHRGIFNDIVPTLSAKRNVLMSRIEHTSTDTTEMSSSIPTQDGRYRKNVSPGTLVNIVQKQDQKNGKITKGTVREILTGSSFHFHGIKVRLEDGRVGRVKEVISQLRDT
jgi:uncharacterized repeat protein (TIGR03833 family)